MSQHEVILTAFMCLPSGSASQLFDYKTPVEPLFVQERCDLPMEIHVLKGNVIMHSKGPRLQVLNSSTLAFTLKRQDGDVHLHPAPNPRAPILDVGDPTVADTRWELERNQKIKLGHTVLELIDFKTDRMARIPQTGSSEVALAERADSMDPETQCRICFGRENLKINPLLCVCHCRGSIEHTHLECLRVWIDADKSYKVKENGYTKDHIHFIPPDLKCSICGENFRSSYIDQRGKTRSIRAPSRAIHDPFVVFNTEGRTFTAVFAEGSKILRFGRSANGVNQNVHIPLLDGSVSREHCELVLENKQLLLVRGSPRYGTAVVVNQPWKLSPNKTHWVQTGDRLIAVEIPDGNLSETSTRTDNWVSQLSKKRRISWIAPVPR